MLSFNEKLFQFIWQHKLLKPHALYTVAGNEVMILNPGELNHDAGPDFFNGRIQLSGMELAGNIELHLKTSDWLKHGHQQNKSYDNIILHVVYEHDAELKQNHTNNVEVLELKNSISEKTIGLYQQLISSREQLPCSKQLKYVDELKFISWLERMTVERLEEKVKRFEELFASYQSDYTQTFYTVLLRNFGFKVNALPFELLAKHLPVNLLLKHSDNLLQLEALLLGVSGLLENQFNNKYIHQLQNEFNHLRNKYGLCTLQKEVFKYSRLRPANFPNLRLAQFAALVHQRPNFLFAPQRYKDAIELKQILRVDLKGYWRNHYTIDGPTYNKNLSMGETSVENILINTVAPFFFFYSKKVEKPLYSELAINLLMHSSFEKCAKTKLFDSKKTCLKSAADSQAIINLYDHYCSKKLCLKCGIWASLIGSGSV
jgi:hypothetical protein